MTGKKELSQAQLDRTRKHGAYAFKERGEDSLTNGEQRSRLQELKDETQTREGVLELLKEQAAANVMTVELIRSFIAGQVRDGVPVDQIPIFRSLPSFQNSAYRSLRDLLVLIPDDKDILDAANVLKELKDGNANNTTD